MRVARHRRAALPAAAVEIAPVTEDQPHEPAAEEPAVEEPQHELPPVAEADLPDLSCAGEEPVAVAEEPALVETDIAATAEPVILG